MLSAHLQVQLLNCYTPQYIVYRMLRRRLLALNLTKTMAMMKKR